MKIFDEISGLKEITETATRMIKFLEQIYTDSGARQKFNDTGKLAFSVEACGYKAVIQLTNLNHSIPAEITEVKE